MQCTVSSYTSLTLLEAAATAAAADTGLQCPLQWKNLCVTITHSNKCMEMDSYCSGGGPKGKSMFFFSDFFFFKYTDVHYSHRYAHSLGSLVDLTLAMCHLYSVFIQAVAPGIIRNYFTVTHTQPYPSMNITTV